MRVWRLGRRPELDGLRGLAVLLVLLCHLDRGQFVGAGAIGVTVFFTLSGFLITTLLLDEHQRTGTVRFGRFYLGRAFRLLPALVAMICAVALVTPFVDTGVTVGDASASLFYVQNYYQLAQPRFTWLTHTWTLSLEEQFYLVWPVVVLGALRLRGRKGVLYAAGAGAAASLIWRSSLLVHGSFAQAGLTFEARCDALLVGSWLAAWMSGRHDRRRTAWFVAPLVVLMAPLTLSVPLWERVVVPDVTPFVTAVLIATAVRGKGIPWLRSPWLGLVGRRSYGLYLWHLVVVSALWESTWRWGWAPQVVLLGTLSWLAALASWRWVESPFLTIKERRTAPPASVAPTVGQPG